MPKIDPLELLRNSFNEKVQRKIAIKQKGNDLIFDRQAKLSLDTETAWISTQNDKQFNLGSLWLYLDFFTRKNPDKIEYFKKVAELKVEGINVADGDQIIKYFTGVVDQSPCINNQLRTNLLNQKSKVRDKPSSGFGNVDEKGQKKPKGQNTEMDQQTKKLLRSLQYLSDFERPLSRRSTLLDFKGKNFKFISEDILRIDQMKSKKQSQQKVTQNFKSNRARQIYSRNCFPTIIVPQQTVPGNISLDNIQKFLIKGQYDQTIKRPNPDVSRISIMKTLRGKNFEFEANCRPQLMSEKDWRNVVAVFVSGRQNQFDHWPLKTHKASLQKPLSFFVKYARTPRGATANWKCQVKQIDPVARNIDKQIVHQIWTQIQQYLFSKE